ncbi:MAG: hypothetical protein ACRC33_16725 [Gemmataceae bacterium]
MSEHEIAALADSASPECRTWLEAESVKIVAGTADLRDFDDILARMDERIARAEAAPSRDGA